MKVRRTDGTLTDGGHCQTCGQPGPPRCAACVDRERRIGGDRAATINQTPPTDDPLEDMR